MHGMIERWARRAGRMTVLAVALGAGAAAAQEVGVTATEILLGEVQPMSGPASLMAWNHRALVCSSITRISRRTAGTVEHRATPLTAG